MNKLLTSLLLAGAMVAGGAFAPAPAEAQVSIDRLIFNGSGCPPGSTTAELFDPDGDGLDDQFQLLFSEYIAAKGPGIPITGNRKNCNITVTLNLPPGFQYGVASVLYEGFVELDRGVNALQRSDYSYPLFGTRTASFTTRFQGPENGERYRFLDVLKIADIVYSPCGVQAPLSIRTAARVYGGSQNAEGQLSVDQIDGNVVTHTYGLTWRRCTTRGR